MKSKLLTHALGAFGAIVTSTAMAAPLPSIPGGPIYIKFDNREQIAVAPGLSTCTGLAGCTGTEINWGVLLVSSVSVGTVTGLNTIEPAAGGAFFNNVSSGGQITGMFYGIDALPAGTGGNAFPATAGFLDLYYRDLSVLPETSLAASAPGVRTSFNTATGYTEGVLLARLEFASGINALSPLVTINGSIVPTPGSGFAGLATSYANVLDTNADAVIDSLDGALAEKFNEDYFVTPFGTRDFRFRNIYEELLAWDGAPGILGARSTDPATTFAAPEPGSLAMVGLGLIGVAALRRRSKKA